MLWSFIILFSQVNISLCSTNALPSAFPGGQHSVTWSRRFFPLSSSFVTFTLNTKTFEIYKELVPERRRRGAISRKCNKKSEKWGTEVPRWTGLALEYGTIRVHVSIACSAGPRSILVTYTPARPHAQQEICQWPKKLFWEPAAKTCIIWTSYSWQRDTWQMKLVKLTDLRLHCEWKVDLLASAQCPKVAKTSSKLQIHSWRQTRAIGCLASTIWSI